LRYEITDALVRALTYSFILDYNADLTVRLIADSIAELSLKFLLSIVLGDYVGILVVLYLLRFAYELYNTI